MALRFVVIAVLLSSLYIQSTCGISPVYLSWSPLNESSSTSYRALINKFSTPRHYGSEGYKQAQTFILEKFKQSNLTVESQTFETFNSSVTGVNLIGILHGESKTNKYYLVGAHYDTAKDNPGVTENGSGMSAVLEIVRLLKLMSRYNCTMDYSVIFVGFDMSRPEPDYGEEPPCPLSAGIGPCGIFSFTDWLEKYLSEKNALLMGAFIIDSILNYNTSESSQTLSSDTPVLLPDYYEEVKTSGYKGNFIAGVVRADDITLALTFQKSWETTPLNQLFQFKQVTLSGVAKPSPYIHISLPTFFQSEHMQLWAQNFTAMLLTDTLQERGIQQQCFDKACDTTKWVSVDKVDFGYQTARAVADSIFKLGNGYCLKAAGAGSLIPSFYTFLFVHFIAFVLLLL